LRKSGRTMLLCGARRQPAQLLKRSDFIAHVGKEHILPHIQAALQHAERMHAGG
jgi:SulP family sulfate permease